MGWDDTINAINIQLGKEHTLIGSELTPNTGKNEVADKFLSPVLLDGSAVSVVAYIIDGSSYFQLDTLKEIVGISVGWDNDTSTIAITA